VFAPTDVALSERVAALEQRLQELEGRPEPVASGSADEFWALEGLRSRTGSPGAVLFTGTVTLPSGQHYDWQQQFSFGDLLDEPWEPLGDALSALSHPVRLVLLRALVEGARTVGELHERASLGTSGQLYHHLRPLMGAGWVRTTARGTYAVPAERVVPLLVVLAAVGS